MENTKWISKVFGSVGRHKGLIYLMAFSVLCLINNAPLGYAQQDPTFGTLKEAECYQRAISFLERRLQQIDTLLRGRLWGTYNPYTGRFYNEYYFDEEERKKILDKLSKQAENILINCLKEDAVSR